LLDNIGYYCKLFQTEIHADIHRLVVTAIKKHKPVMAVAAALSEHRLYNET
jgi:hypothetical protein